MVSEDLELIKEFVIESTENLARLDQEMVELEQRPTDTVLLASIFRTIHTIKGTCGFLGYSTLERITHQAENILSQLRNGERELTQELVSLILETVDAIKVELTSIENSGVESGETYEDLLVRQKEAANLPQANNGAAAKPVAAPSTPASSVGTLPEAPTLPTSPTLPAVPIEPVQVTPPSPPANETSAEPEHSTTLPALRNGAAALTKPTPAEAHPTGSPASAAEPQEAPAPSTAASAGESAAQPARGSSVADSTIRVDVAHLDKLMNLVGELVLTRNQILQFNAQHEDVALNATSQRLNLITTELQEGVMKTRMQPIGVIWNKLPRVVRDLAASCGKQIALEMEGADTELDKTIIEAIKDPLIHIVRNSCDHGIEKPEVRLKAGKPLPGKLMLRAFHEGGNVILEIADDGGGIDPQKVKKSALNKGLLRQEQADRLSDPELVNLVFMPGFSTAEKISNISGRGVGMDVVKTNIEKIGGAVDLVSRPGNGTTVKVRIPLTLAIIPGLVVTSGGERFVIPQASLIELVRLEGGDGAKQIEWIHGAPVLRLRGQLLPLIFLNDVLRLGEPHASRHAEVFNIIVLQADDRQFGLVVDKINDTQEIVVKPLGKLLKGVACYAGATIMGDGRIALILDVPGLAQYTAIVSETRSQTVVEGERAIQSAGENKQALLLFRAGEFERLAIPLSLVARLEEIPRSKLERAAGRTVVQYRQQILPLVPLTEYLHTTGDSFLNDPTQVIVFANANRCIGVVVDQIVDIVEDTVSMRKASDRPGLLGSAVVGQKVTDFLDLQSIIQRAEEGWFEQPEARRKTTTVLLADASPFSRNLLRNTLEIAGHRVLEASSAPEALDKLGRHNVDVLMTSLDLPDSSAAKLLEAVKKDASWQKMPVLALAEGSAALSALQSDSGFDDYLSKFDRASMLRSIEKLSAALHREERQALESKDRQVLESRDRLALASGNALAIAGPAALSLGPARHPDNS